MALRVALVGIYHESNTFVEGLTTLNDFKKGHYLKGEAIRKEYEGAHHEISGIIDVLDQAGIELVPVFFAEATPGGPVEAQTLDFLLTEMLEGLKQAGPVDACLVVPHGAGVSQNQVDMDGYWLAQVRQQVGPDLPIVGTLDLHANVSPRMVEMTDCLVSYKKNPHVDMRQTGEEAARILVRMLKGEVRPRQVLIQPPLSISIEQQFTRQEPCLSLYKRAGELASKPGILSLSILLGFPYADVPEMGTSLLVVSDDRTDLATEVGQQLESYLIENRKDFVGARNDVFQALAIAERSPKPVLLLDMGDNIGGGSPGNNICILEGLLATQTLRYFVCLYDPEAVQMALSHAIGDPFELTVTGTVKEGVKKLSLAVRLVTISDGNFTEAAARHGGQVNYAMGKTVVVEVGEGSLLMITSRRVPPFSLNQLLSCGIEPAQFDVLIAKGVIAPLAAYAPVCQTVVQVNTPGVTQADMTQLGHKNRRIPLFPFEEV
ncbi:M81 family metallopeptidase [Larkinella arboricola]